LATLEWYGRKRTLFIRPTADETAIDSACENAEELADENWRR
jgi:hypothetical protein